jgi:hypothetical protein
VESPSIGLKIHPETSSARVQQGHANHWAVQPDHESGIDQQTDQDGCGIMGYRFQTKGQVTLLASPHGDS